MGILDMRTLFDLSAVNSITDKLDLTSIDDLDLKFADIPTITQVSDVNPLRSTKSSLKFDAVELPETLLGSSKGDSLPHTLDWIPRYKGQIMTGAPQGTMHYDADDLDCKMRLSYSGVFDETTKEYTLTMTNEESHGFNCRNTFLFYTHSGIFAKSFTNSILSNKPQTWIKKIDLSKASEAEISDVVHNGVRFFHLRDSLGKTLKNLIGSLELFIPALATRSVPDFVAKRNAEFLKNYRNWPIEKLPKAVGKAEALALKSKIRTGDMIGILRMDGLDPLLAIGMGSNTGHVVVAAWLPKRYVAEMMNPATHGLGPNADKDQVVRMMTERTFDISEYEGEETDLYIVESTAKDVYWDVNGVQATAFEQWVEWGVQADYNAFVSPASDEVHAASVANLGDFMKFFKTVVGNDYGYSNFLMSWLDDVKNNFPCVESISYLGRPMKWCTNYHHLELLVLTFERFLPDLANKLMLQALTLRAGELSEEEKTASASSGALSLTKAVHRARLNGKIGASSVDLFALPEQDSWNYIGTRFDVPNQSIKSVVCCVFVCNFYRSVGLFGDLNINCGEFTNRDITDVNFYHTEIKPYSLLGKYNVMPDNGYNTRAPYDHMFEKCPTIGPNYEQPADC
eukprot:GDKJ01020108.1.p1 GENE.GDKJ01020108.1~~GDKJ01020108.1.p1  ORF type:complete len:626 (+),score=169.84 GDKJ01020108.1:1-1878(+)